MAYGELSGHVTLKGQGRGPNILAAEYLRNGWRDARFQKTTNRKWPAMYRVTTWPWKFKVVTPIRLGPNISETAGGVIEQQSPITT